MARFTIIQGHPDPSAERLNAALADSYARGARALGHEVRRINVGALEFPLMRTAAEFHSGAVPEAIRQAQADISWADHLLILYPLWMSDVPALFKAFIEQTFRPGFAMAYGRGFPKPLLRGKAARIVVTMGMPAFVYRRLLHAHTVKSLVLNLKMCGISPVTTTIIGAVGEAGQLRLTCWTRRMERLARRDAQPTRRKSAAVTVAELLLTSALLAGGAYLAYVAVAWTRFGSTRRTSSLIDSVMPEYDVRLYHSTQIGAPVERAFEALNHTSVDGSPVVQALFRAREVIVRARHSEQPLPQGLPAQLEAFGWTMVAQEPGHELVFGTVTQPWRPNPVFRGLAPEEFRGFNDPGYAKIALTLRLDPVDPERCVASTETRVKTTDSQSRERFRRYWAFLSPGMEIIRLILLQQLKTEAETDLRGNAPMASAPNPSEASTPRP
jgi:putative NADPH-quinone reductase